MAKPTVALVTVHAAYSVAHFLERMIPTHCPQQDVAAWEEVRDALYAIQNDTDVIMTSDAGPSIEELFGPSHTADSGPAPAAADSAGVAPNTPPPADFARRYLDLSTAHLSWSTRDMLDERGGSRSGSYSVGDTGYGWFVAVPEDDPSEEPADILAAFALARRHGCTGILFDADADATTDLPTYKDGSDEIESPAAA